MPTPDPTLNSYTKFLHKYNRNLNLNFQEILKNLQAIKLCADLQIPSNKDPDYIIF